MTISFNSDPNVKLYVKNITKGQFCNTQNVYNMSGTIKHFCKKSSGIYYSSKGRLKVNYEGLGMKCVGKDCPLLDSVEEPNCMLFESLPIRTIWVLLTKSVLITVLTMEDLNYALKVMVSIIALKEELI